MKQLLLIMYYQVFAFLKWLQKVHNILMLPFVKHPIIENTDVSIDYIIKNKCSVSRFGDGEFALLFGRSIAFQDKNKRLKQLFTDIIYTEQKNHITCLPYAILDTNIYRAKAKNYWDNYFIYNRIKLYKFLNLKKTYYDALLSRLYMDTLNKTLVVNRFEKIKEIWKNQDIIFIEGEKSRLGIGNDLFNNAKSVKRIICPSTNAFEVFDVIIDYITTNIEKNNLLLLALGPTATALAWELSKLGYWAIDIGHIDIEYEWMNMGATEKVPVKNKFVGDTFTFNENEKSYLDTYNKEILTKIN
jgi:glycosyltransferase family protein